MRVLFRCGHLGVFREGRTPQCPTCGASGVARVFAPNPRIVGTATGPLVETKDLDPVSVALDVTPLKLTRQETPDGE
jgi:hypothetical protein